MSKRADYLGSIEGPTPVQAIDGVEIVSASTRTESQTIVLRPVYQGYKSLQQPHNYSHGNSNPRLQPVIPGSARKNHPKGTAR